MELHISVDLGDTLFMQAASRLTVGKGQARQLFGGAFGLLSGLVYEGAKVSVISKIDPGQHTGAAFSLFHCGLVPHIIAPEDVHFCFQRSEKGSIAEKIGSQVHIDDRIHCLNAVGAVGIEHLILFTGGHDETGNPEMGEIVFPFIKAGTWDEVNHILAKIRKAQ